MRRAARPDADHNDDSGTSPPRRLTTKVDPALSAARRRAALAMHEVHNPIQTTAKARKAQLDRFLVRAEAEGYTGSGTVRRAETLKRAFYARISAEGVRARKLNAARRAKVAA